jgi:hypothetical protein
MQNTGCEFDQSRLVVMRINGAIFQSSSILFHGEPRNNFVLAIGQLLDTVLRCDYLNTTTTLALLSRVVYLSRASNGKTVNVYWNEKYV